MLDNSQTAKDASLAVKHASGGFAKGIREGLWLGLVGLVFGSVWLRSSLVRGGAQLIPTKKQKKLYKMAITQYEIYVVLSNLKYVHISHRFHYAKVESRKSRRIRVTNL